MEVKFPTTLEAEDFVETVSLDVDFVYLTKEADHVFVDDKIVTEKVKKAIDRYRGQIL